MVARLLIASALVLAALMAAGCDSPCRSACRHLLEECGIERVDYSVEDCNAGCEAYLQHYEDEWQKVESKQSVRCVANASCTDLREGMPCYDEAVYVW